MRMLTFAAAIVIAFGLMSGAASAHTVSIGTHNAGAPGSVTIWMGSYHIATSALEGSISIDGGTAKSFAAMGFKQGTKPAQLVDGSNNFYAGASNNNGGEFDKPTNGTGQTLRVWQGMTFSGLTAGFHTFQITGMNTVVWSNWNTNDPNWTGRIFIPGSSTQTPEPASLMLLGVGIAGFAAARRRRKSA